MLMHGRRGSGPTSADEAKSGAGRWKKWVAALGGLSCATTAGFALADNWTHSASASATGTYNHYFGPNQPDDGFTTSLTAALGIHGQSARLKLDGTFSVTETYYGSQGQPASFAPNVSLNASLEAIEKFFWIDANAVVTQSFLTPFGPQPANLTTPTNNRYTTQAYGVSPYIKGVIVGDISYSLRDDNYWSRSSSYGDSAATVPATYSNNLSGQVSSVLGNGGGWTLQYTRQSYDNGVDTGTYVIQVGRAILSYAVDPQLTVSARGGYESDHFPALTGANGSLLPSSNNTGAIYGAGMNWRPGERTSLNGYWEHQFFGSSYNWQLTHRLPNVALSATFTRGLTSFPQLALVIPGGVTVAQFLDAAFTTRIPDPAQRAAAVAQFLAQTGLPSTLASPLNFYAQSITLQQTATLSAVWVGLRNSVGLTLFNTQSEAISGTGSTLPPAFALGTNNTQTGGAINYSHRLSGLTNLIAGVTYSTTKPNNTDSSVSDLRSNNFNVSVSISTEFTPKTSGAVGATYFVFQTPGSNNFGTQSTASLFASIAHTF